MKIKKEIKFLGITFTTISALVVQQILTGRVDRPFLKESMGSSLSLRSGFPNYMEEAFYPSRRRPVVWHENEVANDDDYNDHNDHDLCRLKYLPSPPLPQRVAAILDNPVVSKKIAEEHSWNNHDRSFNIFLKDPLTMRRYPVAQSTDCIRARIGYNSGIHMWEITWLVGQRGTNAVVGVATKEEALSGEGYQNMVGNTEHSWGWDLVRNKTLHAGGEESYPANNTENNCRDWAVPDTFNMVLDMDNGKLGFTIENKFLGWSHCNLDTEREVFPIINTVWGNCEVKLRYLSSLEWEEMGLIVLAKAAIRSSLGRDSKDLNKRVEKLKLPTLLKNCLKNEEGEIPAYNNNP